MVCDQGRRDTDGGCAKRPGGHGEGCEGTERRVEPIDLLEVVGAADMASAADAEDAADREPPGLRGGQLGLFDARYLRLQRARLIAIRGQISRASREYARLREQYRDDAVIAEEAERVRALELEVARALALDLEDRVRALLAAAERIEAIPGALASVGRILVCRAGMELQRERGDGFALDGRLPGHYFLDAGELERAGQSLARALEHERRARTVFAWAELAALYGDRRAARAAYTEALLRDPFDMAVDRARDSDVACLPDVARYDFDITDEPVAWCAPAGMVTGVLPRVAPEALQRFCACDGAADRTAALERARGFVRALHEAGDRSRGRDAIIAARRRMKQLQPGLFREYLGRIAEM